MKSKVVIIECKDYEQEHVDRAIKVGMELLGGIDLFFQKEEEILFKPNLLVKASPEKCVTTHPAVFRSILKLLHEEGYAHLGYGDSPGNPIGGVEKTSEGSGLKQVADQYQVPLKNFMEGIDVEFPEGNVCKKFTLCKAVTEADGIINLCKMKTHQLERITGAVKNTFGCVYGINKMAFHAKYPDADTFGKMLADLNLLVKPRLHIMDGIMAMEGNGPQSGTPASMGVLILSADPVAVDTIFCRLVHLNPALVPTNIHGETYGVGRMNLEEISIWTEEGEADIEEIVSRFGNPEFDVYRGISDETQLNMLKPFIPLLKKRPVIRKEKCISCGICVESCPIGSTALKFPAQKTGKKVPVYNYDNCIRCYCCQEMCPQKAIDVKVPLLAKLMDRKWKV